MQPAPGNRFRSQSDAISYPSRHQAPRNGEGCHGWLAETNNQPIQEKLSRPNRRVESPISERIRVAQELAVLRIELLFFA